MVIKREEQGIAYEWILPYDPEKDVFEMGAFPPLAQDGLIDILYDGPDKQEAVAKSRGMRSLANLVSFLPNDDVERLVLNYIFSLRQADLQSSLKQ